MPRVYGSARKRTRARSGGIFGRVLIRLAGAIAPPRLLIIAVIMAGIIYVWGAPYLRVHYSYRGSPDYPVYTRCQYWGYERFVSYGPDCPVIVFKKIDGLSGY